VQVGALALLVEDHEQLGGAVEGVEDRRTVVRTPDADATHAGDGPEDWDRRDADGGHQLWSGAPNGTLVAEVDGLTPGTALDVDCGEGADASWLAQQGWRVTAVDISDVALERARRAARDVGVEVDARRVELAVDPLPGRFDLVSVQYPALRHTPDDAAIRAILGAVALGGTLLVVGHDLRGHEHHPDFDPADYVPDVVLRARRVGPPAAT